MSYVALQMAFAAAVVHLTVAAGAAAALVHCLQERVKFNKNKHRFCSFFCVDLHTFWKTWNFCY
jgi:hypothetical protein